jgi:Flp pilus assembly protein TadG
VGVEAVVVRCRPRTHPTSASALAGPARGQVGAVTAEAAVVIPVLLALVLGSTWFVALAATKVRVVDAAREVARVAARDEPESRAVAAGRQVAPAGTRFTVTRRDGEVVVSATVPVQGPGGLFGFLPPVTVRSEAVAAQEPR